MRLGAEQLIEVWEATDEGLRAALGDGGLALGPSGRFRPEVSRGQRLLLLLEAHVSSKQVARNWKDARNGWLKRTRELSHTKPLPSDMELMTDGALLGVQLRLFAKQLKKEAFVAGCAEMRRRERPRSTPTPPPSPAPPSPPRFSPPPLQVREQSMERPVRLSLQRGVLLHRAHGEAAAQGGEARGADPWLGSGRAVARADPRACGGAEGGGALMMRREARAARRGGAGRSSEGPESRRRGA